MTIADTVIDGRGEFDTALRNACAEIATAPCREIWWCDEDFSGWPIGERAVIEQLNQWAASNRRLTLLARHFDEVARRHPRWVSWRRNWSHIVTCRTNTELAVGEFPTIFWASDTLVIRLTDPVHHRGRVSHAKGEEILCKEQIDAVLQRSEEAFPATTTGL